MAAVTAVAATAVVAPTANVCAGEGTFMSPPFCFRIPTF